MSKVNKRTGLTDVQFASYFASPKSASRYTLEEGIKRAKLRDSFLGPLLASGMSYAEAATIADNLVIDALGK